MEVAGADLGPRVGDADNGLVQVFFGEADTTQVAARSRAGWASKWFSLNGGSRFYLVLCAGRCSIFCKS
jgi:hypothetical protein